jgi:hypothetical protein
MIIIAAQHSSPARIPTRQTLEKTESAKAVLDISPASSFTAYQALSARLRSTRALPLPKAAMPMRTRHGRGREAGAASATDCQS